MKELKAARLAIESFHPMLRNCHIRLHEDNQAVVGVLTNIASRSPRLMAELHKTWYLTDTHGITLSARYIRSAANVWADRLSREVDCDDWHFNPRRFASLTAKWGACTIDASQRLKTPSYPATTPAGVTRRARPSTPCASPTLHGVANRQQLQDAGVDEGVAVDVGVAAKVSTSDGVGRLSSELHEVCEAIFR
eukprot:jgi/Tetstr1/444233/TSEL_032126.t1